MQLLILLSEEGPNTSLSWLLWVTLGFFFVMVLVGWLVSRNESKHRRVKGKNAASSREGDDLKTLEGIGPKVERILNQAGIFTFSDLAGAKAAVVDKTLDAAGLQMMDSAGWIEQAKLAASGDMAGLQKLQQELKGGRKAN